MCWLAVHGGLLGVPHFLEICIFALEFPDVRFELAQAFPRGVVGFLFQRLAFDFQLDEAPVQAIHDLGLGVDLHAYAAGRFVHQIDGLVRQLAIGNVAMGQGRRRYDCRVGDVDAVVHLVALFQSPQDGNGVLDAGLFHQHLLEAPLQRRVLLDVLAVFVEGGGAHAVELAPGQRRLEHIAGVHGALGLAGADHRVQLVDEQNNLSLLLGEIVEHRLQAFLEFAPELGSGDERAEIQRQQALALQPLGYLAVDDALGKPFDDGGFCRRRAHR